MLGGDGRPEETVDAREWECRMCGGLVRGILAMARRAGLRESSGDFVGPVEMLRDIPDTETVVFACPACGRVAPRYHGRLPGCTFAPDDDRLGVAASRIPAAKDPEVDPYATAGQRGEARKSRIERETERWLKR